MRAQLLSLSAAVQLGADAAGEAITQELCLIASEGRRGPWPEQLQELLRLIKLGLARVGGIDKLNAIEEMRTWPRFAEVEAPEDLDDAGPGIWRQGDDDTDDDMAGVDQSGGLDDNEDRAELGDLEAPVVEDRAELGGLEIEAPVVEDRAEVEAPVVEDRAEQLDDQAELGGVEGRLGPLGVRQCNGGPNGIEWCGVPATHVGRDEEGLEWFCCAQHTEAAGVRAGTRLLPLPEWMRVNGLAHDQTALGDLEVEAPVVEDRAEQLDELDDQAELGGDIATPVSMTTVVTPAVGRMTRRCRQPAGRTAAHRDLKPDVEVGRLLYPSTDHRRPALRGECEQFERPCPFMGCRYHLALDVRASGSIVETWPGRELEDIPATCALDVAELGGQSLDEIAAILGVTRERVRQIELAAKTAMARKAPVLAEHLEALHG